ncbi:hypothetical protein [Streptomyces sp. NPDC058486]|uniref:hypothetical protein n=1 Tax=unclassified Streptomyces TaxID=2593676 RepID=UPI003655B6CD
MSVPDSEYTAEFRPTHVVPRGGLSAWQVPDPGYPTVPLDAFLPVRLMDRTGDWGQVLCSNGWSAWVDARLLVAVPDDPPAAGPALTRTADPRPLIARAEDALGRYRRAVDELAAGRADGETFRRRTRGLRVGMVVDGEAVWLYDAEHERWVYCDGVGLTTYAANSPPSRKAETPGPEQAGAAGAGTSGPEAEDAEEPGEAEPVPEKARPAPVAYEPTQVVPELDPAAVAGPPPTQVVPQADPEPPPAPPPTQVVPQADPAKTPAPPPTQVVSRPADADGER